MSKASIICESCGQDNEIGATFCIECGTSISTTKMGVSAAIKEQDASSANLSSIEETEPDRDKSYQSEPQTSRNPLMRCWHMMGRNFNPMFIMMPIMIIIILGFSLSDSFR